MNETAILGNGGELIVRFDDITMLNDIKKAISMIKGVTSISASKCVDGKKQKKLVKESLTRALEELQSNQVKHNARNLFAE